MKSWFLKHVRPFIGWVGEEQYGEEQEHNKEDHKWDSIDNAWKNVVNHVKVGIKIKWKF